MPMKIILSILAAVALTVDIGAVMFAVANHFAKDTDSIDDVIQIQKTHSKKISELDSVIMNMKADVIVLQKLRGYDHEN